MIPPLQVVGVAHDFKSISLIGDKIDKFSSHPGAKVYKVHIRESLVIPFSTEQEGKEFIQKMIDEKVPFVDSERTYAYVDTMDFIKEGKLHGNPVRSTWKDGEYTVHEQ